MSDPAPTRLRTFRPASLLLAASVLSVGVFTGPAWADAHDAQAALSAAPAAVQTAIQGELAKQPGLRIEALEFEDYGEDSVYGITFEGPDGSYDMYYAMDGYLLERVEEVEVAQLPAAVRKTISTEFPGDRIDEAEKITAEDEVLYAVEVETKVGRTERELEVLLSDQGEMLEIYIDLQVDEDDVVDEHGDAEDHVHDAADG
ncbi:MAG: PepSY-like domain-containing protein [Planctomycetota bacterium]